MAGTKRPKFTMEQVLAGATPQQPEAAPSRNRDVAEHRVPITARLRKSLRQRLTRAVPQVQLLGCEDTTLKDILEVALLPLLDDLDEKGPDSELVRRLKTM